MNRNRDPRPPDSRNLRQVHLVQLEARALEVRAADSGGLRFSGHAIVYDRWTEIYDPWFGAFAERIAPGAAHAVLDHDVRLLINHDPSLVLARTTSGTLHLSEDSEGVLAEAELADTTYARDLAVLLRRGDVSQMSFSFTTLRDSWDLRPDGSWARTVEELAEMYDAAVVTYAAYEETDAGMRSRFPADSRARALTASRERTIRDAVAGLRDHADELEDVVGGANEDDDRAAEPANNEAERAAMALQEARHRQFFARHGLGGKQNVLA